MNNGPQRPKPKVAAQRSVAFSEVRRVRYLFISNSKIQKKFAIECVSTGHHFWQCVKFSFGSKTNIFAAHRKMFRTVKAQYQLACKASPVKTNQKKRQNFYMTRIGRNRKSANTLFIWPVFNGLNHIRPKKIPKNLTQFHAFFINIFQICQRFFKLPAYFFSSFGQFHKHFS